jgi:hypothetical protein
VNFLIALALISIADAHVLGLNPEFTAFGFGFAATWIGLPIFFPESDKGSIISKSIQILINLT